MKSLIVAPHPDDEILGVGGTILKRKSEGNKIAWLIITKPSPSLGWGIERLNQRKIEIELIRNFMGFDEVFNLEFECGFLDSIPLNKLVNSISEVISKFKPKEIFIPHYGDVHSDHGIVNRTVISATKCFRQPSVKRIMTYETMSETEFGLDRSNIFSPNLFIDISKYIDKKLKALDIYKNEISEFPFPRSKEALLSLGKYRGASSGLKVAEAFEILRFIE